MPDMYPPLAPSVAGTKITVEQYLRDVPRLTKVITELANERFITGRLFAPGPAALGGAVIFDQVAASELYAARDIQAIEPGSEFPIVTTTESAPLVARTVKWGGAGIITYEDRDRDRRDVLNRTLTRIRNTIVRKVDAVGVAALQLAPIGQQLASGSWGISSAAIMKDVATGITGVDRLDMGYGITSALISPLTHLNITTNDKLLSQLPRESSNPITSTLASRQLRGVLGLTWYVSNRVSDDEVFLFDGQNAGSISDEKPMYSRVVDQPAQERLLVMAARLTVPFVTDPKSVVRLRGVA